MALKWYIGNFMTGVIDKSTPLPVIDGSMSIDYDVNGESEAGIKIAKRELPASWSNGWKLAFESYDKMIVCVDERETSENIIFAGFIYKNQIDIETGQVIDIQARGILEYLRNRLMIPVFDNETDAKKSITLEAPSWRSLIIKTVNHAFSRSGIPGNAPRPPAIMEDIDPDSGDGVKVKTLYTDAYTYGDRLEDIRDNLSSKGQEFRFIPVWDGDSRSRIKFRTYVGSASNPHINFDENINIELSPTGAKLTRFSSTSSGDNKKTRFFIQSLNDEKKTDLTAKYTGGANNVLIDDFFNSPVELTQSELSEQLNARSSDMNTEMVEIALTLVGENKRTWINNLGKKMTITGVNNTDSAGHSIVVRLVEIGFDDSDVIELGVQTPAQRYPRLPKQRKKEEKKKAKKKSKLKRQKYYKGGNGSNRWDQTSLGAIGGGTTTGGGADGGTVPVDPGPLDPGASGDWGTGGGNNGIDTPIEGEAEFKYTHISTITSPFFSNGNVCMASNNTLWACPTFINFRNVHNVLDDANWLTLNSYDAVISSAILFAGGISDAGIAKSFTLTADDINNIFNRAKITGAAIDLPGGFTGTGGSYYDYSLKESYGVSNTPVVLEDNNIYIPLTFGAKWGMRRISGTSKSWASSSTGKIDNRLCEISFAFVCFIKLHISDMREVSDWVLSDKDFRGDIAYDTSANNGSSFRQFEKYGSWIIMGNRDHTAYNGETPTSAANYNSSGASLATWWGWGFPTRDLAIGKTSGGGNVGVYKESNGDYKQVQLQMFPVPLNEAVPLKWTSGSDLGASSKDTARAFTCLGRLFMAAYIKSGSYDTDLVIYALDSDSPLTSPLTKTEIGKKKAYTNDRINAIWTSGRHVYVSYYQSNTAGTTIEYGQITKVEGEGSST